MFFGLASGQEEDGVEAQRRPDIQKTALLCGPLAPAPVLGMSDSPGFGAEADALHMFAENQFEKSLDKWVDRLSSGSLREIREVPSASLAFKDGVLKCKHWTLPHFPSESWLDFWTSGLSSDL